MKLKIISLWQPHATLCILPSKHNPEIPAKPVETRHWKTQHTGWLGIHSAMKKDAMYKYLCGEPAFKKYIPDFEKLPFGYILGMVNISNCLETTGLGLNAFIEQVSDEDEERMKEIREFGDFSVGRFGFTICDFVQFTTPIRVSGTQGFWSHEMPNKIGEKVAVPDNGSGIVLDYNEGRGLKKYLVKTDAETPASWFAENELSFINTVSAKEMF